MIRMMTTGTNAYRGPVMKDFSLRILPSRLAKIGQTGRMTELTRLRSQYSSRLHSCYHGTTCNSASFLVPHLKSDVNSRDDLAWLSVGYSGIRAVPRLLRVFRTYVSSTRREQAGRVLLHTIERQLLRSTECALYTVEAHLG
jgi:hypothetical protein